MDKQGGSKSVRAGKTFVGGWFPTNEVEALDRLKAEIQAQHPALTISRYDAMRTLLLEGLKARGIEVSS